MNQQNIKNYLGLCEEIEQLVSKHHINDVVPALNVMLAQAFVASGIEKEKCLDYLDKTIDEIIKRKPNEKKNHSK